MMMMIRYESAEDNSLPPLLLEKTRSILITTLVDLSSQKSLVVSTISFK